MNSLTNIILGHAMGSVGNAIIYIINEGWNNKNLSFASNQINNPNKKNIDTIDGNHEEIIYIEYNRFSKFDVEKMLQKVMENVEK